MCHLFQSIDLLTFLIYAKFTPFVKRGKESGSSSQILVFASGMQQIAVNLRLELHKKRCIPVYKFVNLSTDVAFVNGGLSLCELCVLVPSQGD